MKEVTQPAPPKATRLDQAIFALFPRWGARRMATRMLWEQAKQKFSTWDGASTNRIRGENWIGSRLSVDSALEEDLDTMRIRSRELYRDEPIVAALIDSRVSNIIGVGLRPQGRIVETEGIVSEAEADEWNLAFENTFAEWAPYSDQNGVLTFWEQQRQIERNWSVDGDVFVRFGARAAVDKPIPLALEVIPSDRVATPADFAGDKNVRLGIRYDSRGRRLGYYVLKDPPGDHLRFSQEYDFVPAFDKNTGLPLMIHLFEQLFPGQSRGVPVITPILAAVKDIRDLREAVIVGEQVKACFSVFIEAPDPLLAATGNASGTTTVTGQRIQQVSPGMVHYCNPGEKPSFANPGNGESAFNSFMASAMLHIAAAVNWPYSWMSKDYRQSTYSSERMAAIDGDRVVNCRQQLHTLRLLGPVWKHLTRQAVLAGAASIPSRVFMNNLNVLQAHVWLPQERPWIDPLKDIQAAVMAIEHNLETKSNVIAKSGNDPEEIMATRSQEKRWEADWGITPAQKTPDTNTNPKPQPDTKPDEEPELEPIEAAA